MNKQSTKTTISNKLKVENAQSYYQETKNQKEQNGNVNIRKTSVLHQVEIRVVSINFPTHHYKFVSYSPYLI